MVKSHHIKDDSGNEYEFNVLFLDELITKTKRFNRIYNKTHSPESSENSLVKMATNLKNNGCRFVSLITKNVKGPKKVAALQPVGLGEFMTLTNILKEKIMEQ